MKSTPFPEMYSNRAIYTERPSGPLWKDAFVKYRVLLLRMWQGHIANMVPRAQSLCSCLWSLGAAVGSPALDLENDFFKL